METITVDIDTVLSSDDISAIASGAQLAISEAVYAQLDEATEYIYDVIRSRRPVYGLNTGLGHLKTQVVDEDRILSNQPRTIRAHNGAIGDPLPSPVVRAAMAARALGLSKRATAASSGMLRGLVDFLNHHIHPVVPRTGSVGAADLGSMAAVGCALIGEGMVEFQGEIISASLAMERAGLQPVTPGPRDGLAIVAHNSFSIGHGALVLQQAHRVAALADIAFAVSLENFAGNVSVFEAEVDKGIRGQAAVGANLRALLSGSYLEQPGAAAALQDPLSFRVAPTVHGACREMLDFATYALDAELNASAHNPSLCGTRLVHNGNFQPMLLAVAFDALRPALCHVIKLAERRLNHLVSMVMNDEDFIRKGLIESFQRTSVLFLYSAAARTAEARQLADPATLDCPPLDFGVEDHATNAPLTVEKTEQLIACADDVLSIELMMAAERLQPEAALETGKRLGKGSGHARRLLWETMTAFEAGTAPVEVQAAVRKLCRENLVDSVESALQK